MDDDTRAEENGKPLPELPSEFVHVGAGAGDGGGGDGDGDGDATTGVPSTGSSGAWLGNHVSDSVITTMGLRVGNKCVLPCV
jgi:hypothetical protein